MSPSPSTSKKRVAIILSGAGFIEGSEITESVSTLISLSEFGAEVQAFAPPEFTEDSSKITRFAVRSLRELREIDFDALVFPGGYGAAKRLSNFASAGARAEVHADVVRCIREFHEASKPIGAICIAPAIVACSLPHHGLEMTVGGDPATDAELKKLGATPIPCTATDYVSDRLNKVLTTPAYMLDARPHEVFTGIRKMLRELVEMC
jgi:enhancing lycopene biosynthesis protein 2